MRDMVKLVSVSSIEEALAIRGVLEANGIQVNLPNAEHAQVDWMMVPALGGLAIQVPDDQYETAKQLLIDVRSETIQAGEIEEDDADYLEDQATSRRNRARTMLYLFLGPPLLFFVGATVWNFFSRLFG